MKNQQVLHPFCKDDLFQFLIHSFSIDYLYLCIVCPNCYFLIFFIFTRYFLTYQHKRQEFGFFLTSHMQRTFYPPYLPYSCIVILVRSTDTVYSDVTTYTPLTNSKSYNVINFPFLKQMWFLLKSVTALFSHLPSCLYWSQI